MRPNPRLRRDMRLRSGSTGEKGMKHSRKWGGARRRRRCGHRIIIAQCVRNGSESHGGARVDLD
eukprot:1522020-Pleurochrysis_carterae.AAC.1